MQKRGQVTVFVIVGIIIFAIVGLIFYTQDFIIKKEVIPPQVQPIYNYIESCVQSTLLDSIRILGIQGGYIVTPSTSIKTDFSTIAYGHYQGKDILPPIKKMQDELSLYLRATIPLCFNTEDFPGFTITQSDIKAKTTIKGNFVSASITYPITVSKGDSTHRLESKYNAEIPIRLGSIHNTANDIIENEISNPNTIELTFLANLDYDVAILTHEDSLIYSITDPNSVIEDIPYTFMFASK